MAGTHGITDFWNHKSGDPLNKLSLGFNSNLCKVDYAWDTFAALVKKLSYSAGLLPGRQKAPKILLWLTVPVFIHSWQGKLTLKKLLNVPKAISRHSLLTMITMTAVMNALLTEEDAWIRIQTSYAR